MLRVILVGYGELASSLMLGTIESGHKLVGVFRWDRVEYSPLTVSLKDFIYPDNFTSLIKSYKVQEIKARGVNTPEFRIQALKLQPDVIIVGSWGEIFKENVIILPRMGCINCHPSLLPKHRGSNPYASALREGETETGITFHMMDKGLDTGPILIQKRVPILLDDTGGSLRTKCAYEARKAVKELLDSLEGAKLLPQKQNEEDSSYFPMLNSNDARIDWEQPALKIHNQVRSMQPWMDCYTSHKNSFIMIKSSKLISCKNPADVPGVVLSKKKNGLIVSTIDPNSAVLIEKLRIYGFMSEIWSNFYINSIKVGDVLGEI